MITLSQFFIELIKHEVVYLMSALPMVWNCHFNLLEPFWFYNFVPCIFLFLSICPEMPPSVRNRPLGWGWAKADQQPTPGYASKNLGRPQAILLMLDEI